MTKIDRKWLHMKTYQRASEMNGSLIFIRVTDTAIQIMKASGSWKKYFKLNDLQ